jgi:long-chain acyl-CoA synthetase
MNVAKNLERARIFFPDKAAILFEGKSYTYRQLDEDVNRLANGLRALGVERGDRVAIFLPNSPGFVMDYFATQKIGAIAVSLNVLLKRDEVKYIVDDSGSKVLFTTAAQREQVPADELASLKHISLLPKGRPAMISPLTTFWPKATAAARPLRWTGTTPQPSCIPQAPPAFQKGPL